MVNTLKNWGWIPGIVLLACLLATVGRPILYAIFYDPAPDVPVTALLLDVSSFPTGWIAYDTQHLVDQHALMDPYVAPRGASEGASAGYGGPGGSRGNPPVSQVVWEFTNGDFAFSEFRAMRGVDKPPRPDLLVGWSYKPAAADHFHLECYERYEYTHVPACLAVFVYGQYLTSVRFTLDPPYGGFAKAEDMRPILEAIDQRMAAPLRRWD